MNFVRLPFFLFLFFFLRVLFPRFRTCFLSDFIIIMVWICRCPVAGSYFTATCISFCKPTWIFQTYSRITRTIFNDLLMDYVIRGRSCHFCHNWRFEKKNITFSTGAPIVFVPKHKTYKAIPAQNVSITKARENT